MPAPGQKEREANVHTFKVIASSQEFLGELYFFSFQFPPVPLLASCCHRNLN